MPKSKAANDFLGKLPVTTSVIAFMLNIVMSDLFPDVMSWTSTALPFVFQVKDWESLCAMWSDVRKHTHVVKVDDFRRSLRLYYESNQLIKLQNNRYQFGSEIFHDEWDLISKIMLKRPWLPDAINRDVWIMESKRQYMKGETIKDAVASTFHLDDASGSGGEYADVPVLSPN